MEKKYNEIQSTINKMYFNNLKMKNYPHCPTTTLLATTQTVKYVYLNLTRHCCHTNRKIGVTQPYSQCDHTNRKVGVPQTTILLFNVTTQTVK